MKYIFWIMIELSVTLLADFTKEGEIVKDSVTKLEWQDDNITDTMEWQEAVVYCENLELGGYSDWRLPNINELKTIIDRSKFYSAIASTFEHTSSSYYWSSTTYKDYHKYAWRVFFNNGQIDFENKIEDYYVRCVRDGQ